MSGIFFVGGVDAIRNPGPKTDVVEDVATPIAQRIPGVPEEDTENLIRLNGAVQVLCACALATNTFARPASAVLAASLVPTTAAGHRFWEAEGAERQQQLLHFLKNMAMWGGLVIATMDTEGQPGYRWRAEHALEHAGLEVEHRKREAELAAKAAQERVRAEKETALAKAEAARARARAKTTAAQAKVGATARQARRDARLAAKAVGGLGKVVGGAGRAVGSTVGSAARKTASVVTPG